ncbi:pirin family protein [Piscinibacter gummiphilus]|uniref:Quercetin 2,3-dioxygenase n=1 Tax=Piscinibacter gummiphilus TaxID=946333 RepID=A0A1W6L6P3_9BURK|nr:pirin family protein [Piscinibacter gummiphilus]ARN19867.1 quercetin 2,3-dioxygenase [Piscinibacter gummiphilus]ATU64540.1 pirin family protein [Piscinibacter gummiphilus]GLS95050.1 pirin family protein [Piscinibacter gummiphilus]
MITLRKSSDRGHADHGWLKSFHSFSFAEYHDPRHMGVGNLRVINEDRIAPGTGFGTHGHRDMEIVSYVLSGVLGHKDSLGNGAQIVPGDVQRMSAGRGIRHSEFNQAPQQETHFLQIWLLPDERDIEPGYEQKHFEDADKRGRLRLVASRDGRNDSVTIHANASMYAGLFDGGEAAELPLDTGRVTYVHLVRGKLEVNGQALDGGDAVTLRGEERLVLANGQDAEVIVFDLAA